MEIQRISEQTVLSDSASVDKALKALKSVPETELHFYLVLRDTLQATAAETRKAITLAQVEWERRKAKQASQLAFITTVLSGSLGIIGVLIGAYLTWRLTH